ncbi:MAG: ribosome biogenesis GTPase Der, partial [Henriciella sp.]
IRHAIGEEAFEAAFETDDADRDAVFNHGIIDALADLDIDDPKLSDADLEQALMDAGVDEAQETQEIEAAKVVASAKPIRLAIIGRPNAGKSTLINQLLGEDRMLTGPEAGITRDSVTLSWDWQGREVQLVDTAGLRRKSRVQERLEKMSTGETVRSLKYADVVALIMDPEDAFEKQDLQIADLALREGRSVVFVVSKWDKVKHHGMAMKELENRLKTYLPQAKGAKLVYLSGLTGKRVDQFMPAVIKTYDDWCARVKTGDLNRWLRYVIERNPPPSVNGKRIKPRYMAQIKARPPTFVLMASRGEQTPEQYRRYLVNALREAFEMPGIPIRLIIRQGANPYADKSRRKPN